MFDSVAQLTVVGGLFIVTKEKLTAEEPGGGRPGTQNGEIRNRPFPKPESRSYERIQIEWRVRGY